MYGLIQLYARPERTLCQVRPCRGPMPKPVVSLPVLPKRGRVLVEIRRVCVNLRDLKTFIMMGHTQKDRFTQMTTESVPALITRLAVPTIVTMLVTALYNMADTFFVGRISTQATAAVGISFSIMSVIQAIGYFFGHGSGNFISRKLGERDTKAAEHMAITGFVLALCGGTLVTVLGEIFLEPLCVLLGSTPTILADAKTYLGIVLLGAPFMASSLVLNNQMRFQGNAVYAMYGIVSGVVLNVILTPLLMFGFGMGIAGAAVGTVVSQVCSFCLLLYMDSRGNNIRLRISKLAINRRYVKEIIYGGSPSLSRQALAAFSTMLLNVAAGAFGDAAIAAMSIVTRICFFIFSILLGFGQGFQPVCGFNYGAKLYGRVLQGFWFCVRTGLLLLGAFSILGIIFAPQLIAAFRHDQDVIRIGTVALRFQLAVFPLNVFVTISNMMLQTIRKSAKAVTLASARQGLFFIPLILTLPRFFGLTGVEVTQSIADVLTFFLAIPLTWSVIKEMKRQAQACSPLTDDRQSNR